MREQTVSADWTEPRKEWPKFQSSRLFPRLPARPLRSRFRIFGCDLCFAALRGRARMETQLIRHDRVGMLGGRRLDVAARFQVR